MKQDQKIDCNLSGNGIISALLNTYQDIALIVDDNGTILAHNEIALQFLDKRKKTLIQSSITSYITDNLIKLAKIQRDQIRNSKEPRHLEYRLKDRLFDIYVYPVTENQEDPVEKLVIFARDITERKKIEASESFKSLQLEKLLETAQDLTSSLNIIEVLTHIGEKASELLDSYSAIYLLDQNGHTLIPKVVVDPTYADEIMATNLDIDHSLTGKSVKDKRSYLFNDVTDKQDACQIPGTSKLNNERIIVVPFITDDKVLGAMCLNRIGKLFTQDELSLAETFAAYATSALKNAQTYNELQFEVEERRKAESELKAHQEQLQLINKILRHDILNNLSVIKSSLNLFFNQQNNTKYITEALLRITKSIDLINRMKELEIFIATHQGLNSIDIREVLTRISRNYPELDVSITGKCFILADQAIDSVIDNIFNNALVHGKATKLDIQISSQQRFCEIRIADNGKGIPQAVRTKIFEESFRYGETGNTGLGLYIVKSKLEKYGGFVFAEENHPQGSIIVLAFKQVN
ncbi:MAG: GAF domain-containing protein [Candidatus Cloacimonetes bacterium]|nr:GAF domain-containing protein [Candidatus Cloacimonadota bacterium]